ncbi:hypothetical protein N7486_004757 [Penicillium sp. IBT 16267x]|nr:hypothetical protein N7486_004757 [Penicillium sp. IBT 16267x]
MVMLKPLTLAFTAIASLSLASASYNYTFDLPLQFANSTLPAPASNETLKFLALGRGTQNYTCASLQSTPIAVGALAVLFDASPLLANIPSALLNTLPDYALEMSPAFVPLTPAGHHFFDSTGTPNFDLYIAGLYLKGMTTATIPAAAPLASSGLPLPETSPVPWLYLTAKYDGVGSVGLTSVYRVEVAGGEPPATCEGITGTTFQVQYSAIYAFYGPANSTSSPSPSTLSTVAAPSATNAPTTCPVSGGPCSFNGQLTCNGNNYGQCANGVWVIRSCASGTICVPDGQGVYCAAEGSVTPTTCS